MRVSGAGKGEGPKNVRKTEKTSGVGGASFARQLSAASEAEASEAASLIDGPSPVSGIDALLAAQSVDEPGDQEQRRRLINHGEDLLDQLQSIQRSLVLGDLTREHLASLTQKLQRRKETISDPKLSAILEEIELRAAVELAKYDMRSGR